MGHYDEYYEAAAMAKEKRKTEQAAKDYAEVKVHLDAVSAFVSQQAGWGENQRYPEMRQTYKLLKGTINNWRLDMGLLIDDPKILLDKLKDD